MFKSAKHKAVVKQAGGVEAAVDALSAQAHAAGVVEAAAGFLRNLATSDVYVYTPP